MPIHFVYVPRDSGKAWPNSRRSIEMSPKNEKVLLRAPIFLCFFHGRAHHKVSFVVGQSELKDLIDNAVEEALAPVAKAKNTRKGESSRK